MILVTCAVERELGTWAQRGGIEPLVTGIGPVEAACAVADLLARRRYSLVVNAGVAGAFDGAARIGDSVVVGDDMLELMLEDGRPIPLPGGERVASAARSDPELVAVLRANGFAVLRGITVAQVTSTEPTAARLARLGAQTESMEGFSVLRACERAGVPAIELRGISNRVGERAQAGWDLAAGLTGLTRVAEALFRFLDANGTMN